MCLSNIVEFSDLIRIDMGFFLFHQSPRTLCTLVQRISAGMGNSRGLRAAGMRAVIATQGPYLGFTIAKHVPASLRDALLFMLKIAQTH